MTDVVCSGCMSRQPAGTQYCGVCGREFPRTGRPVVEQPSGPQSAVQRQAGSYGAAGGDIPYHQGPARMDDDFNTGTLVPVRPSPPPAAPEAVYAHVGKRFVALLIDGTVGSLLFGVVYGIAFSMAQVPEGVTAVSESEYAAMLGTLMAGLGIGLGLMFLWFLSMAIWEGKTGKTLGNLALGIRTVSADGLEPIGFWRVVLRNLVVGACGLVPLAGTVLVLLSPLFDNSGRKQGWHDKAAKAVVIDAKRKPAPEVDGFHPEARQVSSSRPGSGSAPAAAQGRLAAADGLANPGALRAAGQARSAAAASSGQQSPVASGQQQTPPASFTPDGSAPSRQPDPWSFPQPGGQPSAGGGLITDVPGSAGASSLGVAAGQPAAHQPPAQPPAQDPAAQQQNVWPGQGAPEPQQGGWPQQGVAGAPSVPPSSQNGAAPEPSPFPPTSSGTPSPPATANSPRPLTAANTIPEHPMPETSPYPPISQPQQRESQPTRAVGLNQLGQTPRPAQDATPSGRHAAAGPDPDRTRIEPASGATRMQPAVGAMDPAPVSVVVLELESGDRVRVDGPTIVGRNPSAPGGGDVNLVQIPDPMRSVSKNHAELGVDSAGLWLTDRGSTNGTVVSVPGLPPRVAEHGARVRVPVGSTIHFGDRRVVVHPGAVEG